MADVDEGSQSSMTSISSGQSEFSCSGQTEFSAALWRRDDRCVFCNSSGPHAQLEGAHVLPVELKNLLHERSNCEKFGIDSIMDTANGITLCSECHQCFDRNLVCIDWEVIDYRFSFGLWRGRMDKSAQ